MMWTSYLSRSKSRSTGRLEEQREPRRRGLPKLKNPAKILKNLRQQGHAHTAEEKRSCEDARQQEEEQEEEEQLEEVSRRLIVREEQLFAQDSPGEQEEDQLRTEYEALRLQLWTAVHDTFASSADSSISSSSISSSSSSSSSSSPPFPAHLRVLRSAVVSIQQQEAQDQRWMERQAERVPEWRPQKCLSTHNALLQKMVESRMMKAVEEESAGAEGLSSPLKKEVCCLGKCVKTDLLTVATAVKDCYPATMDIVNVYAGLYHRNFSARLTELVTSGPGNDDCSYLLFWTNHYYPSEILKHQDLDGKIKTACLGSLLLQEHLDRLENQYLAHKEDKVKLWLNTALKKEEESWLSGRTPELIDLYCFSPLAVDVIQLMDSLLTEFKCVIRDQSRAQRITAHLESFLCSYRKCVVEFVKGNHGNVRQVLKAHLVCEQQLSHYITGQTGSVSEQQKCRCLATMSALRDCGYRSLTNPIHVHLKTCFGHLWTSVWLDGSLPVVDSLLDFLNQQLTDLTDLKPACRQSLLSRLHQDVVLRYVKRMMKTGTKNKKQQVDGAQRMTEDAKKINNFFTEGGCSESLWLGEMLCRLAEILRLQDPGSVQLEMVSVANAFPDLSDAHVSALLSLKNNLSVAEVRSIRQSVQENRLLPGSTNDSPPFFSMVKVKWINNKINQMGLKKGMVLVSQ